MFNITTVVFDWPSPPFIVQTLWDGTPNVQTRIMLRTVTLIIKGYLECVGAFRVPKLKECMCNRCILVQIPFYYSCLLSACKRNSVNVMNADCTNEKRVTL